MSRLRFYWTFAAGSLIVCCACSCSRFPASPEPPEIDPAKAGEQAIARYDTNSDGQLDGEEIEESPPLKLAMERIDTDGDGKLTAGEIAARVDSWLSCGTTIMSGDAHVMLDGKPLEGATVTFEPEDFLGPAFKPCEGVTGKSGCAPVKGPYEKYAGVYLGFYRIRISKMVNSKETIPARYNTESELGYEIADDIQGVGSIEFHLKSK